MIARRAPGRPARTRNSQAQASAHRHEVCESRVAAPTTSIGELISSSVPARAQPTPSIDLSSSRTAPARSARSRSGSSAAAGRCAVPGASSSGQPMKYFAYSRPSLIMNALSKNCGSACDGALSRPVAISSLMNWYALSSSVRRAPRSTPTLTAAARPNANAAQTAAEAAIARRPRSRARTLRQRPRAARPAPCRAQSNSAASVPKRTRSSGTLP